MLYKSKGTYFWTYLVSVKGTSMGNVGVRNKKIGNLDSQITIILQIKAITSHSDGETGAILPHC